MISGGFTVLSVVWLLLSDVESLPLLLVAAAGAPMTMLLLLRAVADPAGEGRGIWPSLLIGATLVPAVVLGLQGLFYSAGFALVAPFAGAGSDLLDKLRADPDILDLFTDYWAYIFIVEMAIVAPLAEETTKPLGSILRRPRTARDAFMFGAAAGTGFAIVENVLYASGWFWNLDYWLSIATARMVGAGLHAFGAAFVSWGVFQLHRKAPGSWQRLGLAFGAAFVAHGVWNGTIAVTQVLYAGRSELGVGALGNDALAWGVALQALLAGIGALIAVTLLVAGKRLREGKVPLRPELLADLARPRGIAAWAIVSTLLLIPSAITVLVFPELLAL
jgi:RsiW-degrading membrane proteinase PrsW (M82 family)